ncbi:ABC transporter permease [Actinomadura viridis]|uniref:Transport permease protein n=1 Tax=Actinomadura viridis TaxID=58110 RepID=A0A931DQL3_9ACTN|nr:ABC transporter permease [Actinomadura viridis]MBG6092202.1 ABC-2 type transport system permease protein [Actinomadura viridis]
MSASAAVLKAESRLFVREPVSLFWIVAFPTILLTILGLIPAFRENSPDLGGRRVVDLYVPVTVLLALIMSGLQALPPVLAGYRERGILRRMSTTPVRPASLLGAQIVLHGAGALGAALLAILVGRLAFGVALPGHLLGYAVALVLATLSALAMGAAIASLARTTKGTAVVGSIFFFPMMFAAGVYVPVQVMPDALQRVLEFSPFGAASQALDEASRGDWPETAHLGVTALWTALLVWVAIRRFRWE